MGAEAQEQTAQRNSPFTGNIQGQVGATWPLLMTVGLELDVLSGPFQLKPFLNFVILLCSFE